MRMGGGVGVKELQRVTMGYRGLLGRSHDVVMQLQLPLPRLPLNNPHAMARDGGQIAVHFRGAICRNALQCPRGGSF